MVIVGLCVISSGLFGGSEGVLIVFSFFGFTIGCSSGSIDDER